MSPIFLVAAIHRHYFANLWQGLRLAFLHRPQPRAGVGQLLLLLATGWAAALGIDAWGAARPLALAPWGIAAEAARNHAWLALLALVVALSRGRLAFLPLATALAGAEVVLWGAWFLCAVWLPSAAPALDSVLAPRLWWMFLAWQVAIFLRATLPDWPGSRFTLVPLVCVYALGLHGRSTWLPDYPLFESAEVPVAHFNVEDTWDRQRTLTTRALRAVRAGTPGRRELFIVSFAGFGGEDVFRHEAEAVARIMGRRFDAASRQVLLVNNPQTVTFRPLASRSNLRRVFAGLASRMQKEEDIVFLFMTSHGAESGEFTVELGEMGLDPLRPEDVRALLDEAGIKWRVVVVSACFSGHFADALAAPETLLITAAARDRSSFGCAPQRRWTWFGAAYFRDALRTTDSFVTAFRRARRAVGRREARDGLDASEPQMALGSAIAPVLEDFRAGLRSGAGGEPR